MQANDFKNKVILITGGASGIGFATAHLFTKFGAHVIIADKHPTKETINKNIRYIYVDVANATSVKYLFETIKKEYKTLDVAVNSAGILGEKNDIEHYSLAGWNEIVKINMTGIFLCMQHELALMNAEKQEGVIINISSTAGVHGKLDLPGYSATKHAVIGLTKSAVYPDSKIRVHAICPPGVKTPMRFEYTGQHDGIEPEEVANAILWLCSNETKNLNGEILFRDEWLSKIAQITP